MYIEGLDELDNKIVDAIKDNARYAYDIYLKKGFLGCDESFVKTEKSIDRESSEGTEWH